MIRRATVDDIDRLVEMAQHFIAADPLRAPFVTGTEEALRKAVQIVLAFQPGAVFVGEHLNEANPDGTPRFYAPAVGMFAVVAVPSLFGGPTCAEELVWWVEPDYRNTRIGPALLKAAEDWARQHGLFALKLVAPAGADALARFYERRGYAAVETAFVKRF